MQYFFERFAAVDEQPDHDEGVVAEESPHQHRPEHAGGVERGEDDIEGAFRRARVARGGDDGDSGIDINAHRSRLKEVDVAAEGMHREERHTGDRDLEYRGQDQKLRQKTFAVGDRLKADRVVVQPLDRFHDRVVGLFDQMHFRAQLDEERDDLHRDFRRDRRDDDHNRHNGIGYRADICGDFDADRAADGIVVEDKYDDRQNDKAELHREKARERHRRRCAVRIAVCVQMIDLKRLSARARGSNTVIVFSQSSGLKRDSERYFFLQMLHHQHIFERFRKKNDRQTEDTA